MRQARSPFVAIAREALVDMISFGYRSPVTELKVFLLSDAEDSG